MVKKNKTKSKTKKKKIYKKSQGKKRNTLKIKIKRGGNFFELSQAALQKDAIIRGIESFASPGDIKRITKKIQSPQQNNKQSSQYRIAKRYMYNKKYKHPYYYRSRQQMKQKQTNDESLKIPTVSSVAKVISVLR